ncbi:hypothetical protein HRbin33_02597 [bacterium HR33]|nr:hypothetical protein HRbin33_02597 [bacterium HR33]
MAHWVLVLASGAVIAAAEQGPEFNWRGRLDPGQELAVRGVKGEIVVKRSPGNEARVSAVKRWRRSDPDEVRIEVVPHEKGVTICAVYPARRGRANECLPGGEGRMESRDNDVSVDFTVYLPDGIAFAGKTVLGDVIVEDAGGEVKVSTVNGDVSVSARGPARAETVNGSLSVALLRADWQGELKFETVNGSIELRLPEDAEFELRAETVNGGIESDFPLLVQGRFNPRDVRGVVGRGGRGLHLKTVNGRIELRRLR